MRLHHDREGKLVISVQDNGVGLPAERDRIIETYMTTRPKGTGLGFAIVKKIVEEHLCEIAFENATGGGTCGRITLDKAEEGRVGEECVNTCRTRGQLDHIKKKNKKNKT